MNSRQPFEVSDLVQEYDKCWSGLDFVALADLWVRDDPQPIYVGDEYAAPLIGADELDRHWARVAGRLKSASVTSTLHETDVVDDTLTRIDPLDFERQEVIDVGTSPTQVTVGEGAVWVANFSDGTAKELDQALAAARETSRRSRSSRTGPSLTCRWSC